MWQRGARGSPRRPDVYLGEMRAGRALVRTPRVVSEERRTQEQPLVAPQFTHL